MNRTFVFVAAPFIGITIWLFFSTMQIDLFKDQADIPLAPVEDNNVLYENTTSSLAHSSELAILTKQYIEQDVELYKKTNQEVASIKTLLQKSLQLPYSIYDQRITAKLGKPSSTIDSKKLKAQLFYKTETNFKSYLVKIKLKSNDAMKLALGGDELGDAKTTSQIAKAHGAAVAINAGGFADSGTKRFPLGTTMVDGEYVGGFHATYADLFFVGINQHNQLIGGKYTKQEQLDKLKPKFGASFVPILLKKGAKQEIPEKWKTSPARAPRTVIANYKDDQLLIIVTDGYNTNGSKGASLSEMQDLLKSYGVVDAYNLDGGGSSSLIFNGKLINEPSDGSLRKLPTHFLFFK